MSLWQSMKARLGLSDEYDESFEDEYDDEPGEEAPVAYRSPYSDPLTIRRVDREPDVARAREAAVHRSARDGSPQVRMYISEPRSFSEAQSIADKFKQEVPVILNLTGTDSDLAKRFIDFASGLTYGCDGGLQRVADRVFMLSPRNVDVSAEDRRRLKDTGLFGLDI